MSDSNSRFPGDKFYLVEQRLEFIEIIGGLEDRFVDPESITDTPYGGWTHPWGHFDSLRNYLLLTCFDLLGQPHEFVDLGSWLVAKDKEPERKEAIAALDPEYSAIQVARDIFESHSKRYGAKKSFYRFMNEVLSKDLLEQLLFSIKIRRIDSEKNIELEVIDSREQKMKFLFETRNRYTHKAIESGNAAAGAFPNSGKSIFHDGVEMWGYHPIYWVHQKNQRIEYSVRK